MPCSLQADTKSMGSSVPMSKIDRFFLRKSIVNVSKTFFGSKAGTLLPKRLFKVIRLTEVRLLCFLYKNKNLVLSNELIKVELPPRKI